jgi:3-oxoacyl-[acyl-carrier protein] reductase
MDKHPVVLITGSRKGIGRYLAEYYANQEAHVIGCSRGDIEGEIKNYQHFCLDITDESAVKQMFLAIRKKHGRLDVLINNAGVAAMNHILLTPLSTVNKVLNINVTGTFLFCREAAKLMQKNSFGRIVNFTTVAVPLKLEGEAIYASSKAAVITLTEILARELGEYGITVNAIGPTPVKTDLTGSVPEEKINAMLHQQAIQRFGEFRDIANVIDFFISEESDFITGQTLFLRGI